MRFGVLGPLAVWTAGGQAVRVPEVKVRSLLADLLIHAGRAVPADRLVDDLWGDSPPANPAGALQTRVSQLRRALEEAEPGARALVVSRPPGYLLDVGPEATDTGRFAALTAAARRADGPRARAALLADALALWRGEVLADFADEEFARAEIARLDELRLTALEEQAEARLELGEHALLADELGDLVTRHPLRERLRAAQLRALYRAGRQSEALASYGRLRAQLAEELGLDPGPELAALHQSILEQDPALGAPEREGEQAAVRGNLPAPHGELIGRDESVAAVRALLETGRLVTLTGPGGVGKTRLALETARGLPGSFPDGVWLVELSALAPPRPAAEPADVAPGADEAAEAVAAALGVRDETAGGGLLTGAGGTPPAQRLAEALRTKRTLLVLDNCEHVVDAVAALCARLLTAAPGVRVLATGQEPLGVGGEHLWPVAPLDVPPAETASTPAADRAAPAPPGTPSPGPASPGANGTAQPAAVPDAASAPDLAALRASGAVRLFSERAAAAAPGFAVDAANAAAVATVCRRLDGIPLALELAATRVRALGVHELAARLDDRFRLLSAGPRDAPARQRTLRAMLDWSWELLTAPEQAVLRRLSLHAEGCTLRAAEAVCAGGGITEDEVLDLLARLVDRSLVMATPGDGVAPARYHLLESVAAYGREQLCAAGEFGSVRRRHTAYYAALAADAEPQLRGPAQRQWLLRLDAESANMRAALEDAVRTGAAATALGLACDLAWYWVLRGRLGEGRRFLTTALAAPRAPRHPATGTATGTGATPAAAAEQEDERDDEEEAEGAAAAPGRDVTAARAAALTWRAAMTLRLGEPLTPDVLPAGRPPQPADLSELAAGARADAFLGLARLGLGPLPGGDDPLARAGEVFRALGDQWGTAAVSSTLARQAVLRGDLPALAEYGERSMALFAGLGDRWGQLHATYALGTYAEITGDYAQAARLHREGLRMAEDLGLWSEVSDKLSMLGRVALLTGDAAQADEFHGRAARLAAEQGYVVGEEFAGIGLAMGARRQGRLAEAEAHLRHWLDWDRKIESDVGTALILAELGFVAELAGDPERARAHHREGLAFARPTGDPRAVALALEGLAGAESLDGDAGKAARLLGRAEALRAAAGAPLPAAERLDTDRIMGRLRAALPPDALAAEIAAGREAEEP
ncbi:BTAD domain-containing putative transcriptional regulator [Streptomyces sp. MAR4 CNY-716]